MSRYDDMIDQKKPVSQRHRPMPRRDRAKIFAPFAALKGHDAAIAARERIIEPGFLLSEEYSAEIDNTIQRIREMIGDGIRPTVSLIVFQSDISADAGEYRLLTGTVCKIDALNHIIQLDRRSIPIDSICKIEIHR